MWLFDLLDRRMEPTATSGSLSRIFEGQTHTYQSAFDSSEGSSRSEGFWSLGLNTCRYASLAESFRDYTRPYRVDDSYIIGRGQRGSQVLTVDRFPPVLQLDLKRFEYDLKLLTMVKDESVWTFPDEIDLDPFLSFSGDRSEPCIYRLCSVITHEGTLDDGIYYCYVRPTGEGPFVRFHDEQVTAASTEEVFDANFGGDCGNMQGASKTAYMLFYYRVSRQQELFGDD